MIYTTPVDCHVLDKLPDGTGLLMEMTLDIVNQLCSQQYVKIQEKYSLTDCLCSKYVTKL